MPDTRGQEITLEYGEERIPVKIEFAERRRLSISVHPDCSVTALAPVGCSPDKVASQLVQRRAWIARQRRRFEALHPLPERKRFVSGETQMYLGRQYRLKVHRAQNVAVKLIGRFLNVHVPQPEDPRIVRTALNAWYRAHAVPIFRDRVDRCVKSSPSLAGLSPELRIRRMSRRWGSCSGKGTITLSLDLIKTPVHCIEYVIAHELCHLLVHDHSPAFFRMLSRCMPDWKRRKARLDEIVLR